MKGLRASSRCLQSGDAIRRCLLFRLYHDDQGRLVGVRSERDTRGCMSGVSLNFAKFQSKDTPLILRHTSNSNWYSPTCRLPLKKHVLDGEVWRDGGLSGRWEHHPLQQRAQPLSGCGVRSSSSGRSYQPRVSHSCCCFSCRQRASISASVVFTIPSFFSSHRIRVVHTTPGIEADCKYAFESSGTQLCCTETDNSIGRGARYVCQRPKLDLIIAMVSTTPPEYHQYHTSQRDRPTPRALFRVLDETNREREREGGRRGCVSTDLCPLFL